jgi:hypothetical protein
MACSWIADQFVGSIDPMMRWPGPDTILSTHMDAGAFRPRGDWLPAQQQIDLFIGPAPVASNALTFDGVE